MNERIDAIYSALLSAIPSPEPGLTSRSCFELLISVILSAQTTDAQVNRVTEVLFARFPDVETLAAAGQEEVERIIRQVGFFRMKAKHIRSAARVLLDRYNGEVPCTIEELLHIPGVGRKSANVIIGDCFGKPAIIVDTHFKRVVRRVGLTEEDDPGRIEAALRAMVPENMQHTFSMLIYRHGQSVCTARKPQCETCVIRSRCRYYADSK